MEDLATLTLRLSPHLLSLIEEEAVAQGMGTDQLVSELLLRQLGSQHRPGAGRCSLRTGLWSEGPTPLPLQQP
jgi:hypothetical protein